MPGEVPADTPQMRLVYFDIRGLAEPIRWMFKLAGQDFVDERIPLDAWLTRKRSSLEGIQARRRSLENRAGGKSKFVAQFPILFDREDFVITQPLTVMRYVARKYGFNGTNALQEARADEVSDLVYDLRLRAVDFEGKYFKSQTPDIVRHTVFRDLRNEAEGPKKEKMKDDLKNIWLPLYFSKFNDLILHHGGDWIAGDVMTYGDLALANMIDICEDLLDPNCLGEFPKLTELKNRVFALPAIIEWKEQMERMKEQQAAEGDVVTSTDD